MFKNSNKKGFTLIELLVVIAIIGILSAVVLASLSDARLKAKDAAIIEQMSSMRSQAELFYASNGNSYFSENVGGAGAGSGLNSCNPDYSGTGGMFLSTDSNGLYTLVEGIKATYSTDGTLDGRIRCISRSKQWVAIAWLPSKKVDDAGTWWCVDSLGHSAPTTKVFAGVGAQSIQYDCSLN
jgi:prepilin-type N-terminal cleavage/methylation domain-containing protein